MDKARTNRKSCVYLRIAYILPTFCLFEILWTLNTPNIEGCEIFDDREGVQEVGILNLTDKII